MFRVLIFFILIVSVPTFGHADASADCGQTQDLDRRINGCSSYIEANRSSRDLQVWEYVTAAIGARGHTYRLKGQHELAIEDFAWVIKRNGNLVAYLNRAISYEAIGERDKAVADYKHIVKYMADNPSNAYAGQAALAKKALARLGAHN